ncbi:uncharacterized protein LOC104906508 [Beta vulgaris subsp. vulgaris]|uniref:uncharacterized protein LOC104906508 n=1 Tax=Beta vulgaris subsp. vulgaris TaxID=3555 RepID=UPI002036CE02|nr:uncharacterized protein LOC104906508 [Beta vulgaris subsp. vulgaris]
MADDMSDIIPCEIARKIAVEHLDNLDDVESLSLVCSSWRSETSDINYTNFFPSKNTQLPWLMLADSPSSLFRRFYNLSKRMFLKIDIPPFEHDLNHNLNHNHDHDHRRFFSSKGWVITVTRKQALISFFDPFTTTLIKPPSIPILCFQRGQSWNNRSYLHSFSKFIFSDNARSSSSSSSSDFQVAVIYDIYEHIAFWRSGQQQWMKPTFEVNNIEDVCFFKGEFYSIDYRSEVIAYGSELPTSLPRTIAYLDSVGIESCSCVILKTWFYIVPFNQNESTLLIVQRKMCNKPNKDDMSNINTNNNNPKRWWVESISLIELNVDNGETKLIDNIGNRALFVGLNSTFFVEVEDEAFSGKDKRCCRANSIYFTDGKFGGNHRRAGETDLRIFCLKEGKMVEPYYEGPSRYNCVNPPVWVELPHQ